MNPPIPPSALALTLFVATSTASQVLYENPCQLNEELYFVPHPNECNKYYMCNFQQGGLFTCPANLQFNPDLNVCDYPNVVGCINTPYPTEATTTIITENSTTIDEITTTINEITTIKPDNVTNGNFSSVRSSNVQCHYSEDGYAVILPNPEDCSTFFICVGLTPVEKHCRPGLLFNPELSVCDFPQNVVCATNEITTIKPDNVTNGNFSMVKSFQYPCQIFEELYFVPHPNECNKYYMCNFHHAALFTCPANLQFNPDLNVCDYPDVVGCINTPYPTEATTTMGTETSTSTSDPTSIGTRSSQAQTSTTTKPDDDQTTENSDVQCHYSEDGYAVIIPNPEDCSTFFICVGLTPVEKHCRPGLLFNPELSVCDYPQNVTCA